MDPIGTAGSYLGFLLVEWPLPWPAKLESIDELRPLARRLDATEIRLQAVVPRTSGTTARRLVLYRRAGGGPFRSFTRIEREVSAGRLVEEACQLLEAPITTTDAFESGVPVRDLLICSHGRRDACCGSAGTVLARQLSDSPSALSPEVRLWRTSHLGGHRFAPTAVTLPDGAAWAFVDPELAGQVTRREGDVRNVLGRYRGSAGLLSPVVQALEREAFRQTGWGWLDWQRTGEERADGVVRLVGTAPDGTVRTWTGQARHGRTLPVPECGRPVQEAKKWATELHIETIRVSPHRIQE